MAGSLNQVTLLGNVGRDPEVRTFGNGGKVANFSLATTKSWRDKNSGERKQQTEWHNIAVFSEGLVKVCEQHVKKGASLLIQGELRTRSWEKDGEKRYTTEVVLQGYDAKLTFVGSKNDGAGENGGGGERRSGGSSGGSPSGGGYSGSRSTSYDDEIPFAPEWR